MDETNQIIEDMVSDMRFKRRKPVTKQTKQEMAALYDALGAVLGRMNKLHLALWHAQEKSDYHSTNLQDAMQELRQIRDEIDKVLKK